MKAVHTTQEIQSLAKMDVILVLVFLVWFLVQKWHVEDQIILANMKVTHTMKETLSIVKMDVILVLALLDK
jgi:hypothetical protein